MKAKREIAEKLFTEILQCQSDMNSLAEIANRAEERNYGSSQHSAAVQSLRAAIYQREVRLWRDLAMWGMTLPVKDQERIRTAYYERCVKGYVKPSWFTASDDDFNTMAREAFLPQHVQAHLMAYEVAQRLEQGAGDGNQQT
jgi:hypothetical protein